MPWIEEPRLPQSEVWSCAARYEYDLEPTVESLVPAVKGRGHLTQTELLVVGRWKSARVLPRLQQNSGEATTEVTRAMLLARTPRLAVHIPQALVGVGMPVGSTLLHWFHSDRYPILDVRALWSLGIEEPSVYSLNFWERYVERSREVADRWGVDMRTLDRALWQYSKEHAPASA